jgi:hypothetical protein
MKIEQLLGHHGIPGNPFGEEDAQTDAVFKRACMATIHHPSWSKFFGDPGEPSTAVVFGEKGSGKTALRLQATAELEAYNASHPEAKVFVVEYDDFNPFLDHYLTRAGTRDVAEALRRFQLRDHMDAILALGTTTLLDELTGGAVAGTGNPSALSVDRRRDLLLLAALYDQSTGRPIEQRWNQLRRRAHFRSRWMRKDLWLGTAVTLAVVLLLALVPWFRQSAVWPWLVGAIVLGWGRWLWGRWRAHWLARDVQAGLRVFGRDRATLRRELAWFEPGELTGQPLPTASRGGAEERYELFRKFQGVIQGLGYRGVIVLIDRVDEPQAIAGDPRLMRALVWPLLDHKFLRHPGLGMKLLLPIELAYYLEKEDKEFYDRARPDKLNLIKPLRWTGSSLYDLATDRMRACANGNGKDGAPRLRQLIDDEIGDDALRDALGYLRTPRQLFKFLHRLMEEHCHRHTEDKPRWSVDADTFRAVYANHMRELDAFDRGFGHG